MATATEPTEPTEPTKANDQIPKDPEWTSLLDRFEPEFTDSKLDGRVDGEPAKFVVKASAYFEFNPSSKPSRMGWRHRDRDSQSSTSANFTSQDFCEAESGQTLKAFRKTSDYQGLKNSTRAVVMQKGLIWLKRQRMRQHLATRKPSELVEILHKIIGKLHKQGSNDPITTDTNIVDEIRKTLDAFGLDVADFATEPLNEPNREAHDIMREVEKLGFELEDILDYPVRFEARVAAMPNIGGFPLHPAMMFGG